MTLRRLVKIISLAAVLGVSALSVQPANAWSWWPWDSGWDGPGWGGPGWGGPGWGPGWGGYPYYGGYYPYYGGYGYPYYGGYGYPYYGGYPAWGAVPYAYPYAPAPAPKSSGNSKYPIHRPGFSCPGRRHLRSGGGVDLFQQRRKPA